MGSDWAEVGERVYVRRHDSWDLNVGLIVGDDGCLVVDTRASRREGRELAVPGHGTVVDREFVAGQRAMLTDLAAAARQAYAAGRPVDDAVNVLPLKPRIARHALARAYRQLDRRR